ncbi:hypothetical protein SNE40_014756 [Patella caerulea]|uniref:Uncharacterized protein n=1 Tax=Patella caerulea TaxID=87958 RepID=A0AAN8PJL8_PATCE
MTNINQYKYVSPHDMYITVNNTDIPGLIIYRILTSMAMGISILRKLITLSFSPINKFDAIPTNRQTTNIISDSENPKCEMRENSHLLYTDQPSPTPKNRCRFLICKNVALRGEAQTDITGLLQMIAFSESGENDNGPIFNDWGEFF